ncbi:hypothetical protein G7Y89_g9546 [Cudoniella acicularis]|uniref:NadR/Ttd14 AAA domain-containing protein n=1 Tax=Cudoniella acicularis TaxID=354080 RepID=A0A8H4REG0_9HELO|nr:hypothetical protein G7Y89_g9546 [Cudoniella acicularis]
MNQNNQLRNIYIVGAQCTGKTTLTNALEDHFKNTDDLVGNPISGPKFIKEVARTVLKQHDFTASDIKFSPAKAFALQRFILKAQLAAESAISETGDWFISDRSGADPLVYARRYVGKDAESGLAQSSEWKELQGRLRKSLVIVCEAGADWLTDDGVRLMPEDREDWVGFHQLFCRFLDEWDVKYEVLPFAVITLPERVEFVLERWKMQ